MRKKRGVSDNCNFLSHSLSLPSVFEDVKTFRKLKIGTIENEREEEMKIVLSLMKNNSD
jgi:hypothetical protein